MLNTDYIADDWRPIIHGALNQISPGYLSALEDDQQWLPGPNRLFNAFRLPLADTRYILFGESPYPRQQSANGYAFWDADVGDIWSDTGLSKTVNRATSLRNFIKMLLLADNKLSADDLSQPAIQSISKASYVQTLDQLFNNMLTRGFLLLNATLVLSDNGVRKDANAWQPFMESVLQHCQQSQQPITLILFGKIAEAINRLPAAKHFQQLVAVHPYNVSFITEKNVLEFFRPMHLLAKESKL